MKKAFDDYSLIAGNAGMGGSLWKGPDHLLVIEPRGFIFPYREFYRRIDYKNIQALTITNTRRLVWLTLLLFIPLSLFVWGLVYNVQSEKAFTPLAAGIAVPVVTLTLILLIHLFRGQTCRCSLQTAVLSLRLKPLKRNRKAVLVLQQIETLCRQHQGDEPPPALDATPQVVPPLTQHGLKPAWQGSRLVQVTLVQMLALGALVTGKLFIHSFAWFVSIIVVALIGLGLLVASIVQAFRHRGTGGLQAVLWGGLVTLFITAMTGYGVIIASFVMTQKKKDSSPADALNWLANLDFKAADWSAWLILSLGIITMVLALCGLPLSAKRVLPESSSPATPPPMGT